MIRMSRTWRRSARGDLAERAWRHVSARRGVGLVTKKGLPVPPGEPAINPAPRKLIAETIQDVLGRLRDGRPRRGRGDFRAGGEELAKKTFNPRLGIVGGISILGTTGIVVPYSTAAWLASVTQEIDVAAAQGISGTGADGGRPRRAAGAAALSRCPRRRSCRSGRSSATPCATAPRLASTR